MRVSGREGRVHDGNSGNSKDIILTLFDLWHGDTNQVNWLEDMIPELKGLKISGASVHYKTLNSHKGLIYLPPFS